MGVCSLTPSSLSFTRERGTQTVRYSGDYSGYIDADTVPDWLTFDMTENISPETDVAVTASANSGEVRTASVRFHDNEYDNPGEAWLEVTQDTSAVIFRVEHSGEFLDVNGTAWRCEILRKTDEALTPSDLDFPADSPLMIEWAHRDFESPVWGASATLKVISPGDRTYIGLYTVEPGTVMLRVSRQVAGTWSEHWRGMLDTEFYEEPYERLSGYEVSLTFTDFGILDRLAYDLGGMQTVNAIIARCMEAAGFEGFALSTTDMNSAALYFDTEAPANWALGEAGLAVRSDNFLDEEGEPSTLREVLEAVLLPLGLYLFQNDEATPRVYNLRRLANQYEEGGMAFTWSGDSQTLSVGKVYNDMTVTFSPYASDEVMEDALEYDGDYDITDYDLTNDNTGPHNGGLVCYTYYPDYSNIKSDPDYTDLDFTIFLGEGSGVTPRNAGGGFFHILPVYGSAAECSGYYYGFYTGGHGSLASGVGARPVGFMYTPAQGLGYRLFTTARVFVPAVAEGDREKFLLRVVQEVMLDCRYNPFNGAGDGNEEGNQSTLEGSSAFVFNRVSVELYGSEEGGEALWHYDNSTVAQGGGVNALQFGEWLEGADGGASVWLEWYSPDDLTDNSGGAGGWKANRHCVGKPDGAGSRNRHTEVNALLRNADDGEYIPFPPEGGWLEVTVWCSVYGYQWGGSAAVGDSDRWTDRGLHSVLRWWLYKCPDIYVVRNSLDFASADLDDVEYSGTLNAAALDSLDIDTICGTAEGAPPTARGVFYRLSDGSQVSELLREGVTARPEKMLIGELYSQYAGRTTVLTGEADFVRKETIYRDDNQPGVKFCVTADSRDYRLAVTELELTEVGEDNYTGV